MAITCAERIVDTSTADYQ